MRIEKVYTIGNESRTMAFGVLSFSYMEKALGKSITEIQSDFATLTERNSVSDIFDFCSAILYGGLMAAKSKNNLPKDFSIDTCKEWIDEMGLEQFTENILPGFVESITVRLGAKEKATESGEVQKPQ